MIKPAPVRKSVTAGLGRWWPSTHSVGKSAIKTAVIEPRIGGRWYEIGEDGNECDWGDVLAWEAPTRILLAWRIGVDWQYHRDLHTEVDVRFTALGENSTRVDLEHRLLENMGATAEKAREIFESDGGWTGLLAGYQAEVARGNA